MTYNQFLKQLRQQNDTQRKIINYYRHRPAIHLPEEIQRLILSYLQNDKIIRQQSITIRDNNHEYTCLVNSYKLLEDHYERLEMDNEHLVQSLVAAENDIYELLDHVPRIIQNRFLSRRINRRLSFNSDNSDNETEV